MEQITRAVVRGQAVRVGVDLAKRVIQVHAVDIAGHVLSSRALPRDKFIAWCAQLPPGCIVAMKTCSSSHHWARKLIALDLNARIIAAQLVSPYRRQGASGKNDANDAAAICEAASRPQMHFVPVKSISNFRPAKFRQLRTAAHITAKFKRMLARRVMKTKAVVAVARELAGFVWAIGREVQASGWTGVKAQPAAGAPG